MPTLILLLAATAPERPSVAVMDLVVKVGLSEGVGALLSERMTAQFASSGRFERIIGASDVRDMLDLEQQKNVLGCDDSGCLAELGGALGVPYLVTSSVGKVGSRLMLNIKLLAVEEARVSGRISALYDDEDQLVEGLSTEISEMLVTAFGSAPKSAAAGGTPATQPSAVKPAPPRRFSWLGIGLIGAGAGAFYALAPSQSELIEARQDYDQAMTDQEVNEAGNELVTKADAFNSARALGSLLSITGVLLNVWAYWSTS